jgi:hypothetical protein
VRSFLVLVLVGSLGFLAGCGSSGTPAGIAITISLSPTSATVNANGVVNVVATVANDSTNAGVSWTLSGVGTLSNQTTTSVTYTAPATVTTTSVATVVATSKASSSVTASLPITVSPAGTVANVVPISVNGGPLTTANPPSIYANGLFVSVQICAPSNGACQTIPDVLVDTGSVGFRVLASQLNSQVMTGLQPFTDGSGNTLYNCIQFADNSFLWGTVAPANIVLGGETAASTSVQVIATPSFNIPSGCTGTNEDTQQTLSANGILGVGAEPFDCGAACDQVANPQGPIPLVYYFCSSGGTCNATYVPCGPLCEQQSAPDYQVTNPVFNFTTDNNGVIVELPAVNDVAATVTGSLIFGIGTQSNNALPSTATVLNLDTTDSFTTNFASQSLTGSFIDSGSNGLFFPDPALAGSICPGSDSSWYCPTSTLTGLSATNVGATGSPSSTVTFSVDNFETVTAANPTDAAFSNLAGPNTGGFDWGLPFFYGRNVFTGIDGTTVGTTPTPFFAY